jgi:D-3-phosphoglycerate dehydrogenase
MIILCTTSNFTADNFPAGLKVIKNPFKRKLTEAEVATLIEEHQPVGMIAGVEPLTRAVLKKAKNLKVISRCGIGLDSVDLEAARELGIVVTNTPDAPTIPVAELTLGMILNLMRHLHIIDAGIRRGKWERPMGRLLHGKTVGIVGCGRIGSYVAKLVSAFGCRVLGCDPYLQTHQYCKLVSLDTLLAQSDIVSLHIPYSADNHHLISTTQLALMKPGAILINAARGGLVDEQALYEAVKSGHLGGAAIDCFEKEPYTGPLKELPNVLLTAHIGSYAKEARTLMEQQAVENLVRELQRQGVVQ